MRMLLLAAVLCASTIACADSNADQPAADDQTTAQKSAPPVENIPQFVPAILREAPAVAASAQDERFDAAARAAWAQVERGYSANTGLVAAQPTWSFPTTWDIASALAAFYSARGLGYINDQQYKDRVSKALATLKKARLYQGIAYGRNYDANSGELVGPDQKPHQNGTGYSAIDVGRLLVWLNIIAKRDPDLAPAAEAVARRVDAARALRDGYMRGEEIDAKTGKPVGYQEGRIGYEQYSATGFSLWGMKANSALNWKANAKPGNVLGIPIPIDKRGLDRLTSEPVVLQGLELGWDAPSRELAWQTLSAQAARFLKSGQITIVSEDAINRPPHYFYYYCVYCGGREFVINVHSPGTTLTEPRWVSTKAAFAWHALMPTRYTWQAIEAVQPSLDARQGWATGVFEQTSKSTETFTLNTAAVILEAALYRKIGRPLIQG
jgi:hypothetical protein